MVKKQSKSHAEYYVEVRDHIGVRRNILESLRDVLDSLQKFNEAHKIREEKQKKIMQLKDTLRETSKLIFRLRSALPTLPIQKTTVPKKVEKSAVSQKQTVEPKSAPVQKAQPEKKPRSDLELLEEELAAIEKKLSKLN